MTLRQRLLKRIYPLFMWWRGLRRGNKENIKPDIVPPVSFYSLSTVLNNGSGFSFEQLKGKYVLLVNTASNCGFTGQYAELQQLYEQYKGKLEILGFPANDFKQQEKGTDADIQTFCRVNYGVTFPLAQKSSVVRGKDQHPVYSWLSSPELNGWNRKEPSWNFSKYLVGPGGKLLGYFGPAVSPADKTITGNIK